MAVTIPSGYGQAAFVFSLLGKTGPVITTIGISDDPTATPSEIAENVYNAWTGTNMLFSGPFMQAGWGLSGVTVSIERGSGPLLGQHMDGIAGQGGADTLPPNCAFLVRKGTSRGGRHGRGRMYLPPTRAGEGSINAAGVLDGSLVVGINNALALSLAAMVAGPNNPVLLHEDGSLPDLITSLTVQSLLATQRRRLR